MALAWPTSLKPRDTSTDYIARSVSGGAGFDGTEQVVSRDAGVWRIRLSAIQVRTADQVRAFRALILGLDGRANTVLVPICEAGRIPRTSNLAADPTGAPVVDPPFFRRWPKLAGTQFEFTAEAGITGTASGRAAGAVDFAYTGEVPAIGQYVTLQSVRREIISVAANGVGHVLLGISPALPSSSPRGLVASVAAERATQIVVQVVTGVPPAAGQYFSLGNHLHGIVSIAVTSGANVTLNIRPPLRASIAVNDGVEFDYPVCECRLTADDQSLALSLNKFAGPSLEFMEAR